MVEPIDWSLTTFEGNRRFQQRQFLALPFRQKLEVLEGLSEVAARLGAVRAGRVSPIGGVSGSPAGGGGTPSR